jgi:hypothetical protein
MLGSQGDDLHENISLLFTAKIFFHLPFEKEQVACQNAAAEFTNDKHHI